ncbi:MAG: hypothetical protein K8F91_14995 [Candidatus Obscuribacterales bacterium]|nr:hypothetical protein [Candidatus Obscuribacterales bacterium]
MQIDPVASVDRIARAIERVLVFDGWIGQNKIYQSEDLKKIAESMARRASEPSKYINQGLHNTSVTQSKMRQMLETDPASVLEPLADLVTSGRAKLGRGDSAIVVEIEQDNLRLDLEARLANDESIQSMGLRDASGQLFDILLTQALWNTKFKDQNPRYSYVFRQEPGLDPDSQATGEKLYKLDKQVSSRQELIYEGPRFSIAEAIALSEFLDGTSAGLFVHSTVAGPFQKQSIDSPDQLIAGVREYYKQSLRPSQILIFANRLFPSSYPSNGHDLHMICAQYHDESGLFFCQSHWGRHFDGLLNGVSCEILLKSMILPMRTQGPTLEYDEIPPHERIIDPAFPIRPADRAEKLLRLKQQVLDLANREQKLLSKPEARRLKKYRDDLLAWEQAKKEHGRLFGESIPFTRGRPEPPEVT